VPNVTMLNTICTLHAAEALYERGSESIIKEPKLCVEAWLRKVKGYQGDGK
jgi:hypothetical protein